MPIMYNPKDYVPQLLNGDYVIRKELAKKNLDKLKELNEKFIKIQTRPSNNGRVQEGDTTQDLCRKGIIVPLDQGNGISRPCCSG